MKTYNIHHINTKIQDKNLRYNKKNTKKSFQNLLEEVERVKFSKHAAKRIDDREISINDNDVLRINNGMIKAREKGVDNALILMDNKAFIASVKNNTIITTINSDNIKNNVFTNIDGAVIV